MVLEPQLTRETSRSVKIRFEEGTLDAGLIVAADRRTNVDACKIQKRATSEAKSRVPA